MKYTRQCHLALIGILVVLFTATYAQKPSSHTPRGETKPVISGSIVDEQGDQIPYASVAIYSSLDSVLITGTASDGNGEFKVQVASGNYYIKITFLSFGEKTISNIQVDNEEVRVGVIRLKPGAMALKEVVVEAQKSQIELHLDKRVFNVGSEISNTGSNASEILDNIPSVSVDVDGNVSLRGSENVRILIDGKPSALTGISSTDALRQLQGDMIERVEIITNPSARYDAEGEVGIINIVLKKEKRKGVNGSFGMSAGYPDNYSGSFSLNYRQKKINLFASCGINYRKTPGSGHTLQEFSNTDTVYSYKSERKHMRGGVSNNVRLGADFFLNDQNIITASGLYKYSNDQNNTTLIYNDFNGKNELVQTTERTEEEYENGQNSEASLNYRKTFKRKGRELTADFKWTQSDDTEHGDISQSDNYPNPLLMQRTNNTEDERNWLFQSDYVHPFSEDGKFEAGLKSTNRIIENDFIAEQQDSDLTWYILPEFNNHFIYDEKISAAYIMLGNKLKKISYQAGLRTEYSDITTELVKTGKKNNRTYINIFPSVHFSYELKNMNTLQLSYSRRLSRPSFRNLLPFFSLSDNRNFYSGNPDLYPEYTHSVELGNLKNWEKGSLLGSIYYRYRTGVIERITTFDSTGYTHMLPVNLSSQNAFGLEFNVSYELLKWWRLNGSFNFYRVITDGQYKGELLHSDTYTWTGKGSSRMTIFKKADLQLSFNYRAPRETTQGKSKAMYTLDTGISKDVFKGNGTLILSVKDILNTRKYRRITNTEGYYADSEFQWRSRQLLFSFNYRLNQKKKRQESNTSYDGGEDINY